MFKKEELDNAIKIHTQAYKLLLWVADGVDNGRLRFSTIHNNMSPAEVISRWLSSFYGYDYVPNDVLPKKENLENFSRYFGSYLTTSFNLVQKPKTITMGFNGCACDVCLQLLFASHLKAKSPQKYDKLEAETRCIEIVQKLAQEENLNLTYEQSKEIANSSTTKSDTAYLAYAEGLLERIKSSEGGVYLLVLWRQIAWNSSGSPIKGFTLQSSDILKAEENIKSMLQGS